MQIEIITETFHARLLLFIFILPVTVRDVVGPCMHGFLIILLLGSLVRYILASTTVCCLLRDPNRGVLLFAFLFDLFGLNIQVHGPHERVKSIRTFVFKDVPFVENGAPNMPCIVPAFIRKTKTTDSCSSLLLQFSHT